MKILVTQLARLGDIFLSYPSINALRRKYPDAEIHLLVREKFRWGLSELHSYDRAWIFNSKEILRPIVAEKNNDNSLELVDDLLSALQSEEYTNIINLSYSPLSSYLVHSIASENTQVVGYTRYSDGYLSIPDDTSAYFYAQVGVGRSNRVHLADIFAATIGVELEDQDWSTRHEYETKNRYNEDKRYIVVHIGASQTHKTLTVFKWRQILKNLVKNWEGKVVLIGAENERASSDHMMNGLDESVTNLVGRTTVGDLFPLIRNSELLIGPDSMALHVASLVGVRALNLSMATVNFYETGPYADGSRVIFEDDETLIASDRVVDEALAMIQRNPAKYGIYERVVGSDVSFVANDRVVTKDFSWNLIKALYMGSDFPVIDDVNILRAVERLGQMTLVACEQIELIRDPERRQTAMRILEQSDEIFRKVSLLVPEVEPMVNWFLTEKTRMPPMGLEQVINETYDLYKRIELVLSVYVNFEHKEKLLGGSDADHEMG